MRQKLWEQAHSNASMAILSSGHKALCRVSGSWGTQPEYNSDRRECPLYYERLKYEDIRDRRAVPYLLGGRQRPHCRQCHSNAPWARFCSWDFSRFSKCGELSFSSAVY